MPTGLIAMAGNVLSGGRFMGSARADGGRSLPVASCSRDSFTCSTHKHTASLYLVMGGTPRAGHDEAWPTSTCVGSGQVGCSSCAGSPGGDLPRRPSLSGRATCSPIANCMVQPACHLKGSLCVRGVLHDVRQQVGAFNSLRTC